MRTPTLEQGKVWESGEGLTNTGFAQVVCGPAGEKLVPVFADRDRASFAPVPEMLVICIERPGGGREPNAALYRYEVEETFALVAEGTYQGIEIPEGVADALNAAMDKAECYHCRCVHWALVQKRRR